MKNTIRIIISFLILLNHHLIAQNDIEFSQYLGLNTQGLHHFGPKTTFPENKISEDFGPRTPHNKGFHGGIDYNSRGVGDQDIKDLLYSLESGIGTIYYDDGVVQNNRSKYITIQGQHNVRYIHIFEAFVLPYPTSLAYTFGGTMVKYIDNAMTPKDWAIIFMRNGNYNAIGPTVGTVTFADEHSIMRTIAVSNTVSQGDPVAPLGNSKTFQTRGHLHLELLTQLVNANGSAVYPSEDKYAKNPLQITKHTTPNYCISMLHKNDITVGVDLVYPGTKRTVLQGRVEVDNDINCNNTNTYGGKKRYNETMNIEKLDFRIKSDAIFSYQPILGQNISSINLGGVLGSNVSPASMHTDNYAGNWGSRNGVCTEAYNKNPWDDYYLNEFYTRLNKNYNGSGSSMLFTDTPIDSRYNDGDYQIHSRVADVNNVHHHSPDYNFTLDNFQPFITRIEFNANNVNRCSIDRLQSDNTNQVNDGRVNNSSQVNNIIKLANTNYVLYVNVSEPVQSLFAEFRLVGESQWQDGHFFNLINVNDPLKYVWTPIQPLGEGDYEFRFTGKDKSGNDLVNIFSMTDSNSNSNDAGIPTRISNNSWTNLDADHQTGEDFILLEINPNCAVGNHLIYSTDAETRNSIVANCSDLEHLETIVEYDCLADNYSIQITGVEEEEFDVFLQLPSGDYEEWNFSNTALDTGTYCYLVYSDDPCCFRSECISVSEIKPFEVTIDDFISPLICSISLGGLDIPVVCDGSIDISITSTEPNYSIRWFADGEFISSNEDLDGLCGGQYVLELTNSMGCIYMDTIDLCCCLNLGGVNGIEVSDCASSLVEVDVDAEISNATNENSFDGSIELTILDSNAPLSITWIDPFGNIVDSIQSIFNLNPGTYCVSIVSGCQVLNECFVVLNENCTETFNLNGGIVDACNESSNGSVFLNPAPAELALNYGPYSYQWSDGSSENSISNLPAGEVCVTVTNEIGCQVNDCFEVGKVDVFIANENIINATDHSLGSIQLSIVGNINTVTWSNGDSGTFVDELATGVYSVTVTTDNPNCNIKDWFYVGNDCHTFQFESIITDGCEGEGSITLDLDESDYDIRWFEDNTLISTGNTLSSLSSGEYCAVIELDNGACDRCFVINNDEDMNLIVNYDCGILDIEIVGSDPPFTLTVDIIISVLGDQFLYFIDDYEGNNRIYSSDVGYNFSGTLLIKVLSESCKSSVYELLLYEPYFSFQVSVPPENIEATCIKDVSVGSAIVDVQGGQEPYIYQWSQTTEEIVSTSGATVSTTTDYGTGSSINISETGKYCVTVTDECGNIDSDCIYMECFKSQVKQYSMLGSCPPENFGIRAKSDFPCRNSFLSLNTSEIILTPEWESIKGTITIIWPDFSISYFQNDNGQKKIVGKDDFDIHQNDEYYVSFYADWLGQKVTCIFSFYEEYENCGFITPSPLSVSQANDLDLGTNSNYIAGCYSCTICGRSPEQIELFNFYFGDGVPTQKLCEEYSAKGFIFMPDDLDNPCTGGGKIIYTCPCKDAPQITVVIPPSSWGVYLDLDDVWLLDWDEDEDGPSPYSVPNCALGACIFDPQMVDGTVLDSDEGEHAVLAYICLEAEETDTIVPDVGLDTLCRDGSIQFIPSESPCVLTYYCLDDPSQEIFTIEGSASVCHIETDTTCIWIELCEDNCDIIGDIVYDPTFQLCQESIQNPDCPACIVQQLNKFNNDKEIELRGNNEANTPNSIEFNLFPNPARNVLILRTENILENGRFRIMIYNINGKLVSTEFIDAKPQISFDISNFLNGIYLMQVDYGINSSVLKFHKI